MSAVAAFVKKHPVAIYFVLTFLISWGGILAVICAFGGIPATREQFNVQLPIAIPAMLGGPGLAGLLMTGLVSGRAGFRELFSRLGRWRVNIGYYALALFLAPVLLTGTLLVLSLFSPAYLPGVVAAAEKEPIVFSGMVGGVMVAIFEEIGWTGFAVRRLRPKRGLLAVGLVVGVVWGAWHILSNDVWGSAVTCGDVPPAVFLVVNGLLFLSGQLPAYRIITVWVWDRTGSLLVCVLMHAALTATTLIVAPFSLAGTQLLVYGLVSAAVMWVAALVVMAADHGRFFRKPASGGKEEST